MIETADFYGRTIGQIIFGYLGTIFNRRVHVANVFEQAPQVFDTAEHIIGTLFPSHIFSFEAFASLLIIVILDVAAAFVRKCHLSPLLQATHALHHAHQGPFG